MNTSRLLIAAACSLTLISASSVAFAQTTSPDTSNSGASNQNQSQNADRTSNTMAPGSTNSTTQRQSESGTSNDTGTRMGATDDDSMRNADGSTMRMARTDRN